MQSNKLFPYDPNNPEGLSSSYIHFNLGLTEEQKKALKKLKISNPGNYENNGNLDQFSAEIQNFLILLDPGNIEISLIIANLIVDLVKNIRLTLKQESAWVAIRASTHNGFTDPRWHTDGYYFSPQKRKEQYKVVASLKGPSTLFHNLPPAQREAFNLLNNNSSETGKFLKNIQPESVPFGDATVFTAGSKEKATVHSEPCEKYNARFFISVVAGSLSEINEREKRQKEFEQSPEYQKMVEELRHRKM